MFSGITSISAQILFVRELFVLFYGNEIIIGFSLAIWLLWGALGSALLSHITDRLSNHYTFFTWLLLAGTILIPITIFLIRAAPLILGPLGNQIYGPPAMLAVAGIILFPFCITNGLFFASGCHLIRMAAGNKAQSSIGRMYMLEALGSAVGGTVTGIMLIRFLDTFSIAAILAAANAAAGLILAVRTERSYAARAASALLLTITSAALLTGTTLRMNKAALDLQWTGYTLADSENSPYGSICVTAMEKQVNFYQNGLLVFSVPDRFSSEEGVLMAALQHPAPENVLIIGGDGGGILKLLLKLPRIKHIDYVELDPSFVNLVVTNVPPDYKDALRDRRVRILTTDGRRHLQTVTNKYDLILMYLPDPYTAQINRFYTREFYRYAANALRKNGVFSFSVTSSENYVGEELAQFLASLVGTLRKVFPEVRYLPGNRCLFLASNQAGCFTVNTAVLEKRLADRGIEAFFFRDYYLAHQLSERRIRSFTRQVEDTASIGSWINTDFHPISYYFDMVFWGRAVQP